MPNEVHESWSLEIEKYFQYFYSLSFFNYRKETSFLILHSLERKILTRLISKFGGQERGIDNLGNYQTAKELLRGNSCLRKWS